MVWQPELPANHSYGIIRAEAEIPPMESLLVSASNLHVSEVGYLWIFATVMVIHLTEEFCGGMRSSDRDKLHGLDLSRGGFIRTNLVAVLGLIVLIVIAVKMGFPQFLLVSLGTFILVNGMRHAVKSLREITYSPGLITGILVFLPLGVLTLIRLEPAMSIVRFGAGMLAGVTMQLGASFVAHRGRQTVQALIRR
jgi:hypothetical protein